MKNWMSIFLILAIAGLSFYLGTRVNAKTEEKLFEAKQITKDQQAVILSQQEELAQFSEKLELVYSELQTIKTDQTSLLDEFDKRIREDRKIQQQFLQDLSDLQIKRDSLSGLAEQFDL